MELTVYVVTTLIHHFNIGMKILAFRWRKKAFLTHLLF